MYQLVRNLQEINLVLSTKKSSKKMEKPKKIDDMVKTSSSCMDFLHRLEQRE